MNNNNSWPSSSVQQNYIGKEAAPSFEMGELDQIYSYMHVHDHSSSQEEKQTLNIFPSHPMHALPSPKGEMVGLVSLTTNSNGPQQKSMATGNLKAKDSRALAEHKKDVKVTVLKKEANKKGTASSSEQEGPRTPDAKTLRRLAQNREAARKSRLRKKAYIQQLETSKVKLTQMEQDLNRLRSQGMLMGGGAQLITDQGLPVGTTPEAAMFDMDYTKWVDDQQRLMLELRSAMQDHNLPENQLRMFVDSCLAHYGTLMQLKSKSDPFHLLSGLWKSPAERCFLWIAGFRPSDLIKVCVRQTEPLTEEQLLGIYAIQQSAQESEEAMSQGLEALYHSLSETMTSDILSFPSNLNMAQMALAINKISALQGFVRQADNLRLQTLHRLRQILTTHQIGRFLLAMTDYFHRLRALSSLWIARPRDHYSVNHTLSNT